MYSFVFIFFPLSLTFFFFFCLQMTSRVQMTEDELIVHFFQFDGNFNSQVTLYYVISFKHVPYFISYIFCFYTFLTASNHL